MKNSLVILGLVLALIGTASCKRAIKDTPLQENTATVYYNGDIITMEGNTPQYEDALVERDGRIEFSGDSDKAMELAGEGHMMIDLGGKTLLPGFIDGHGHIYNTGLLGMAANVLPAPDGPGTDFDDLVEAVND